MTSGTTITVACIQLEPVIGDAIASLTRIDQGIREAAQRGANLVVLPELANCGYMFTGSDELRAAAQPLDGSYIRHLSELARELGIVISSGFAELAASGEVYNAAVIVDRTGVLTTYRKAHLWNTEKVSGFSAGDGHPPVVDTEYGRLGLKICYDLEFPEWVRRVALAGADLLCVPVNWPLGPRPEGERPCEIIRVQADAAVNRMYIAVADRVGIERGQEWLGGTVIVDADGFPVSTIELGKEFISMVTVDLGLARDKSISPLNDVHGDRRLALYDTL